MAMLSHIDPFFHSALNDSSITHLVKDKYIEIHNVLISSKTFLCFDGECGGITLLVQRYKTDPLVT